MDEKYKTLITNSLRLTISDLERDLLGTYDEISFLHPEVFLDAEHKILTPHFSEWLENILSEFVGSVTIDIDQFIEAIIFNFAYLHTDESPYEAVSMNHKNQKMIQDYLEVQSDRTLKFLSELEDAENKAGIRLSNRTRSNSRINHSCLIDELKEFHNSLLEAMKITPTNKKQGNHPHGSSYFIAQVDLLLNTSFQLNENQRANILARICKKLGFQKTQKNIVQILRNNRISA